MEPEKADKKIKKGEKSKYTIKHDPYDKTRLHYVRKRREITKHPEPDFDRSKSNSFELLRPTSN